MTRTRSARKNELVKENTEKKVNGKAVKAHLKKISNKVLSDVQHNAVADSGSVIPHTNDPFEDSKSDQRKADCTDVSNLSDATGEENIPERQLQTHKAIIVDEDTEKVSFGENAALNDAISGVVSKHIEEEEERLKKLNDEQAEKDTQKFIQDWEKEEESLREERYEKLQLLLKKSEMYTKWEQFWERKEYLLSRMEQQKKSISDMKQLQNANSSGPPSKKRKTTKESIQPSEAETALCSGAPILFTGQLRPYQVDGLVWLNTMYENGVNGILADEMGLGKTIQCIASIAHLVTMNVRGPFLIVVPLSTLPNWVNEFKRFAPKVPVLLYHGSKHERPLLRQEIRKFTDIDGKWSCQPVVCTSYEVIMMDKKYLMSINWKYLIVDEGHRIKNTQCRLIKDLRLYNSTHRVLLTGTPLQNNLSELWSLLNFLLPEVFDDLDSFEYWFQLDCLKKDQQDRLIAEEKKRNILAMLHKSMTPFLLRRLKCDVELNLPPKREVIVYAPLTKQQRELYEATVNKTILFLLDKDLKSEKESLIIHTDDGKRSKRSKVKQVNYATQLLDSDEDDNETFEKWTEEITALTEKRWSAAPKEKIMRKNVVNVKLKNKLMDLRKCCSHPYLLNQPIDPETQFCRIDEEVVTSSGKMLLLDAMLKELKKTGHKVLLFSQMTKMLDLIEDYCYLKQFKYCRLDGSTGLKERGEQMREFNTDPDIFLFLLSTRAGGLGINLVAADTVIIFDSDWNPQCDLQAQDRAHRIGQVRPVVIYRLVCANTIDDKIVERAARKRRLEKMIIHKEKFKTGMTKEYEQTCKPISTQELLELLKSRDHDAVVVAKDGEHMISKKDLDALLDRSDLHNQWKDRMAGAKAIKTTPSGNEAKTEGKRSSNKLFKIIEEDDENPSSAPEEA